MTEEELMVRPDGETTLAHRHEPNSTSALRPCILEATKLIRACSCTSLQASN